VKTDLETLITAQYVKIDDELVTDRWCGRPPLLSDSELVCLAVAQALLQVHNEARWLRFVGQRLGALFPYRPKRPGYDKRLRAALPLVKRVIRLLARDTGFWLDTVWITDSTRCRAACPGPRSSARTWPAGPGTAIARATRGSSGAAAVPGVHPVGMPILWALANPKLEEREALAAILEEAGAGRGVPHHAAASLPKGRGRTLRRAVAIRVAQRVLALAAAIWHNHRTAQAVSRSLTAYDH
jgi:hypothetical protein